MLLVMLYNFTNQITKYNRSSIGSDGMSFKTSWCERDELIVVQLRFQPLPIWIGVDRMSVIVEIRDSERR